MEEQSIAIMAKENKEIIDLIHCFHPFTKQVLESGIAFIHFTAKPQGTNGPLLFVFYYRFEHRTEHCSFNLLLLQIKVSLYVSLNKDDVKPSVLKHCYTKNHYAHSVAYAFHIS